MPAVPLPRRTHLDLGDRSGAAGSGSPDHRPDRALHPASLGALLGLETARDLLARRAPADALPITLDPLARLLPGGLHRGELHELVGDRSSGRFSIVLSLLAAATLAGEAAALVDLGDHFDPQDAARAGVCLDRLLWLRPAHLKPALAAAETAITGGFPLVICDLGTPPIPGGRGAQSQWLRLLSAARSHRAALLVSTPYRACGTAATTVVEARRGRGRWRGDAPPHRLLEALAGSVTLKKMRGGVPESRVELTLRRDPLLTDAESALQSVRSDALPNELSDALQSVRSVTLPRDRRRAQARRELAAAPARGTRRSKGA